MVVFRRAFSWSSFWMCVYINIEITHISRRWCTPQNFLLHLLMTFEKPKKWEFWKNKNKNCWRYHHFTNVYQKPQSCEVQFQRYGVIQFFMSFWAIFCPLHLCTTNDDHTMYGSWNIKCDWHNSLSFQAIFFPFTSVTVRKIKISEKWKKTPGDIIILHKPKIMSVSEISRVTDVIVVFRMYCCFSFLAIFYRFTRLTAWKMKISQKWKKQPEISSFYTSVRKIMIRGYTVPEVWHVTDVVFIFHFGLFFALLPP